MGLPVNAPSEATAALVPTVIRDLTTTRQKISLPSGALWVVLSYRLLPGATAVTGQIAKFVINAASDADAAGKLATDGACMMLAQGDDKIISATSSDPITRIDIVAEQVVGAEKTIIEILSGVKA